jgi:hypothetical protein
MEYNDIPGLDPLVKVANNVNWETIPSQRIVPLFDMIVVEREGRTAEYLSIYIFDILLPSFSTSFVIEQFSS